MFKVSDSLWLQVGSEILVNVDGCSFFFGSWNGECWQLFGSMVGSMFMVVFVKVVVLDVLSVVIVFGVKLDFSGGGQLLGWQFVVGFGGLIDIFSVVDGSYVIVFGVQSMGIVDNLLFGQFVFGC